MDLELKDKVVWVTGSSRGIGFEIARGFLREGARVVLNGRDKVQLEKVVSALDSPGVLSVAGDVSSAETCQKIFDEIKGWAGKLDVLVTNVGTGRSVPTLEEDGPEFERMFAMNFYSAFHPIHVSKEELIRNQGAIVCISSICGRGALGPATYSASKAALNNYLQAIARPLGRKGVRINGVAPGHVLFEGSVWEKKVKEDPRGVEEILDRDVPVNRMGTPKEIADFVCFLASPRASFATGGIFTVDGGQLRW